MRPRDRCKACEKKRKKEHDIKNRHQAPARYKKFIAKRRLAAETYYAKWQASTSIEFKPITEEAWLKACEYFGGCAICGDERIETRQFFIGFQHGGKYAPWNVFPACAKCSNFARQIENPFAWIDHYLGSAERIGMNEERRQRLLMWFIVQIEEASK